MNKKLLSLDRKNSIFFKVTKGCTFGHRIDYNAVGVLRGQRPPPRGGVLPYISHIGMIQIIDSLLKKLTNQGPVSRKSR